MSIWDIASQGAGLVGGTIQAIGAHKANSLQYDRQKLLMDKAQQQNQSMALFNKDLQMQMWKDTGPQGQMEQLKLAGLNPGLIYGMGGAGGQTAQAAQAQGQSTPSAGVVQNTMAGMGIMGLQIAEQIQLLKAQKDKTNAEAESIRANTPGAGQIQEKIGAETSNLKAQESLIKVNTAIAEIDKQIKTDTQIDVTNQITNVARQAQEQLEILMNQNLITTEEAVNARQTATEKLIQLQLQNEQARKNRNLTEEQIKQVTQDVTNATNLANMQLKINDLPKSIQTILQTIFSILHAIR